MSYAILPELVFTEDLALLFSASPLQDRLENTGNEVSCWLGRAFAQVWFDFDKQLKATPIVEAIENGSITSDQYQSYLRNMRQQVSQGARWITRAASSMDNTHVELRNALIRHASAEHQDFRMLENDYVNGGGTLEEIQNAPMNIGSEALSSFIMSEASFTNPAGIFGATFIIEGLGSHKAASWANGIQQALNISNDRVSFLRYHGEADHDHYDNLVKVLTSPFITPEVAINARRIAKIVGRLYALQLQELDNF